MPGSSAQFDERKVEPNSGLGKAISYLLNHWEKLRCFCGSRAPRWTTTSWNGH